MAKRPNRKTKSISSAKLSDESREQALTLWQRSIEIEERISHSFDRAILTLSAGALAISITFVNDIAPNPTCTILLGIAWLFFGSSMTLILVSLLTSQSGMRRLRVILESQTKGLATGTTNTLGSVTHWLNVASVVAFVLGVVFLAAFSYMNLIGKEVNGMTDKTADSSLYSQKGFVPPAPMTVTNEPPIHSGFVPPAPMSPSTSPTTNDGGKGK